MSIRTVIRTVLAGALLALAVQSLAAGEQRHEYQLNVPAQGLMQALKEFARQTKLQVVYYADVAEGVKSPGAKGSLSADDALGQMLDGTGLEFVFINERTVAIRKPGMSLSSSSQNEVLQLAVAGESSASAAEQPAERSETPQEVVVTGTHIRGEAARSSPLTTYTRERIEKSGAATLEQFARQMPENLPSVDAGTTQTFAVGGFDQDGQNLYAGAGFNIHGLGPDATLTLVNGHRMAAAGSGGAFVDISLIPLKAIERIEVLTDGASALYGTDAVAGVVNIITRKDFSGAETGVRYGGASRGGANEFTGSQIVGGAWHSGNAMAIYEYDRQSGLQADTRAFIPTQTGRSQVLPQQRRNSVFFTGRQELSNSLSLSADGIFSKRSFVQSLTPFGSSFLQQTEGTAEQYSGSVMLEQELFADWRARLTGSAARVKQPFFNATVFGVTPFIINTDIETRQGDVGLQLDGSLFSLPAGAVKAAWGAGWREEKLNGHFHNTFGTFTTFDLKQRLSRDVSSVFGEVRVPLIGAAGQSAAARLEMSLAGRYERYSDFGSTANPKVGLVWMPVPEWTVRATYGTSFRSPLLVQLIDRPSYVVYDLPDAGAGDGSTITLNNASTGNPDLQPQKSTSVTAGIDWRPEAMPEFSMGATWFTVKFRDRIAAPPINDLSALYSHPELAPFIDRAPDPAAVQALFDQGVVQDTTGVGAAGVEAIYSGQIANLAVSKQSGVELHGSYQLPTAAGTFAFSVSGTHLLKNDYQLLRGTPYLSLLDTLGGPVSDRARAGVDWSKGEFGCSLGINYRGSYDNTLLTPAQSIDSWTTADLQLSYRSADAGTTFTRGLSVSLSLLNLFNQNPPRVTAPPDSGFNLGYDPINGDPVGRLVAVEVRKAW